MIPNRSANAPRVLRTVRTGALALVASAPLAAPAAAGSPGDPVPLAPLELILNQDIYVPGDELEITIKGRAGDYPLLVIGATPGPTWVPGIGEMSVGASPTPFVVRLPALPESGETSVSCNFGCRDPLVEAPCFVQAVTFDPFTFELAGLSNPGTLNYGSGDCFVCADVGEAEPGMGVSGDHALWLPGIGTDFEFVSGGHLAEHADGTARLLGVVARRSEPTERFAVDVELLDRVSPGDPNHAPAGSPKQELAAHAYLDGGGAVDPRLWRYYETTIGTLTGLDDLDGAVLQVSRRGPAFQVGYGANGKNTRYGASGWLDVVVLSHPNDGSTLQGDKGDINIDLGGDCEDCARAAGDHAITMPQFGDDFLFVSGGVFEERVDGTARLTGEIVHDTDPLNRWAVQIEFMRRINPGSPSHPPAGSPKQELGSGAYADNGGIVDPDAWHYYQDTVGYVAGLDDNLGALLLVTRMGPAFQVGLRASGCSRKSCSA